MNIVIDPKLKNTLINKKSTSILIKSIVQSGGWCGTSKTLKVETLNNFYNEDDFFHEFVIDDFHIFIGKNIKTKDSIEIYQSIKLPILGPIIGVKGILSY